MDQRDPGITRYHPGITVYVLERDGLYHLARYDLILTLKDDAGAFLIGKYLKHHEIEGETYIISLDITSRFIVP